MMLSVKKTLEMLVGEHNAEKCITWCVGPRWASIQMKELPKYWNHYHKDLFEMNMEDDISACIDKMVEFWKRQSGGYSNPLEVVDPAKQEEPQIDFTEEG